LSVATERKALFARRDLVERLIAMASSRGSSLYSLVNEIFELYIEFEDRGIKMRSVVDELEFYRRVFGAGFVLVPNVLWLRAVNELYKDVGEEVRNDWLSLGTWLSRYYQTLGLEDPLRVLLEDIKKVFSWLGEVSITSSADRGRLEVVMAGVRGLPSSIPRLVLDMVRGALKEYGYRLTNSLEGEGVLKAVFERETYEQ